MNNKHDVIVIGGGPAGMMAAGRAASRGRKVLLLEKNSVLGKKLDITGGGRCNITNATFDNRELLKNYGEAEKFLYSAFAQHSVQDTINFFKSRDLPIVVEARNRAFPKSQKASDVTKVLRKYLTDNNVEIKLNHKVIALDKTAAKITKVKTNKGSFGATNIIVSTGGTSHPETGSTGEGFDWLKDLGHRIASPSPNLVPLTVAEDNLTEAISGTSLTFMKISFWQNGKVIFSKTGKVLFTHFGLSGPLILNSSYEVTQLLKKGEVHATIDMYPDTELPDLDQDILDKFRKTPNKHLKNILKDITPKGMTPLFLKKIPQEVLNKEINVITKEERRAIVDDLKGLRLEITGNMGKEWAIISDGGVDLREIDTKYMRSKLIDNLFLIGDVLNINRPSGGYSLQLCWTTGIVAGEHV